MTSPDPHTAPLQIPLYKLAKRLGCGADQVKTYIALGMPHVRTGRTYRFVEAHVMEWLERVGLATGREAIETTATKEAIRSTPIASRAEYREHLRTIGAGL